MRALALGLSLLSLACFADDAMQDSVSFRMKWGAEDKKVRMPLSDTTTWKNPAWKGGVTFALKRLGSGVIHVEASVKVDGKVRPAKSQDISLGETFTLVPGVDVDPAFFGPDARFELTFQK